MLVLRKMSMCDSDCERVEFDVCPRSSSTLRPSEVDIGPKEAKSERLSARVACAGPTRSNYGVFDCASLFARARNSKLVGFLFQLMVMVTVCIESGVAIHLGGLVISCRASKSFNESRIIRTQPVTRTVSHYTI